MAKLDENRVRRIEELVRRLEAIPDAESRATAQALMEAILELHGAGLDRILEILFDTGESGRMAIRRAAADPLVSSLLVLHGLHPDDLETRVQHALAKLHGAAELITAFDGVVRIRISGGGCGLRESVEAAVRDAAPDAADVVIDESPAAVRDFVSLASLQACQEMP